MNIFGVHLDRRDKLPPRGGNQEQDPQTWAARREFFNCNASDDEMRADTMEKITHAYHRCRRARSAFSCTRSPGARSSPLAGAEQVASKKANRNHRRHHGPLAGLLGAAIACKPGLLERGARIFAMTSSGGTRAIPNYGPVSAAKAILEAHIRQLALELAPAGITANAILAGVTDTPALRLIPGHEKLMEIARLRNPHQRLTTPEDVARSIAALCHPATYWLTGNTLHVDGGENIVG